MTEKGLAIARAISVEQADALHEQASTHYLQAEYAEALACWRELSDGAPEDDRATEGIRMCKGALESVSASVTTAGASPFAPDASIGEPADSIEILDDDRRIPDLAPESLDLSELATPDIAAPSADAADPGFGDLDSLFADDVSPAPAAAAPPSGETEAIPDIDELLDLGDSLDAGDAEPGAAEGEHLLDLTDLSEGESADSAAGFGDFIDNAAPAVPAEPAANADHESWNWGADGANPDTPPLAIKPPDPETAARKTELELRRRINELLASALVHMEKGERSEALRNLDRLLILDESNETALTLKHKLMRQDDPNDESADLDRFAPVDTHRAASAPTATEESDPDSEPLDLFPESGTSSADHAAMPPAPEPALRAPTRPRPARSGPPEKSEAARRLPGLDTWAELPARSKRVYVVGLLTIVLGGLWAINRFGGGDGEPLRAVPPDSSPVATIDSPPVQTRHPVRVTPPVAPVTPVTGPSPGAVPAIIASADLPTLLGQASRAMDENDYAAAVIRYKAVLDREPTNRLAARGLIDAGEAYREQQESRKQETQARRSFADGDYRAALRGFYRMPVGENDTRLPRWKFNGWYNLTIAALRTSNCTGASEALGELRGLDPRHPSMAQLDRLVAQCGASAPAGWRLEVERLTDLGLDD